MDITIKIDVHISSEQLESFLEEALEAAEYTDWLPNSEFNGPGGTISNVVAQGGDVEVIENRYSSTKLTKKTTLNISHLKRGIEKFVENAHITERNYVFDIGALAPYDRLEILEYALFNRLR